ncbi:glutaminyl-peptide cyclotransferase [Flavobacterium sp.]|uniref:glutaminyl-peptide cyclotransferase n=1 Tax=Flavobacterium sp. TaxID=239 RepID=UPI0039E680E6
MKSPNFLSLISLSILLVAGGCQDKDKKYFSFDKSTVDEQYKPDETAGILVLNPEGKTVDSVVYYLNDVKFVSKKQLDKLSIDLKGKKLGYQNIKALVYFDGNTTPEEVSDGRIEVISPVQPKFYKYTVVNTYPHDEKAFTEGLEFFRDTLIESTGQKGGSYFRKFDYKTGFAYKQVNLDPQYFGEGITVINDKIFQLTWQENTGFIYNANTMKQEKTFQYDRKIEGWGMTNDGKNIYHSDGTETIWTMDPNTHKLTDYIKVYTGSDKVKAINELEWIDGKIYGNIWQKDVIAIIDPATGSVVGAIDLSALRKEVKSKNAEVLNGIAYNPKTKTIFVTGKYWDKMFEIRVSE